MRLTPAAVPLRSNDLPVPGYNLGGYPTLFFFPADDRLPRHISHAPGDYGTTRAGNHTPHICFSLIMRGMITVTDWYHLG